MNPEEPDELYTKYRGLIRSLISSIVVNNPAVVTTQDLQQTGALALMVALQSYDPSLGSLSSYIRKCVRNALLEQANMFNAVFTVDEKVRRQANAVQKMKRKGWNDEAIMQKLGIKTKATFLSLVDLAEEHAVEISHVDAVGHTSLEEDGLAYILDEIGLDEQEIQFVNLIVANHSMDEMMDIMNVGRTTLYSIKTSIQNKIKEWSC